MSRNSLVDKKRTKPIKPIKWIPIQKAYRGSQATGYVFFHGIYCGTIIKRGTNDWTIHIYSVITIKNGKLIRGHEFKFFQAEEGLTYNAGKKKLTGWLKCRIKNGNHVCLS